MCRLTSYYPADVDSKAAVWLSASERFPVSYCSYYSIQWMCMTTDSNCKLKDAPDLIANVLQDNVNMNQDKLEKTKILKMH